MMRTTQTESSLFLGQKKAHWAELKGGSRWRTHLWSNVARERENETMLIHDTSQRFGLFEHASMCNQKGGVKIQNRGPEQEIPAVTCIRLIAQKHRYKRQGSCPPNRCANPLILENELKLMLSLISCRSGIFRRRECRSTNKTKLCLNYWTQLAHKKTTRKLRKTQGYLATISLLPLLLALIRM